jgi:hypothetical protein
MMREEPFNEHRIMQKYKETLGFLVHNYQTQASYGSDFLAQKPFA